MAEPKKVIETKAETKLIIKPEPPKSILGNRKSDGFAGFSHEDTKKPKKSVKITNEPIFPQRKSAGFVSPRETANTIKHEVKKDVEPTEKSYINGKLDKLLKEFDEKPNEIINKSPIAVRKDLLEEEPETKMENNDLQEKEDANVKDEDETMEIVYNTKTAITPHESVPDVRKWDCDEVYTYFLGLTTSEYAHLFKEHQIDGAALLLIKRDDVLNRFNLKLGPALRLYARIVALQHKNNNPILVWNEN